MIEKKIKTYEGLIDFIENKLGIELFEYQKQLLKDVTSQHKTYVLLV